MLVTIIQLFIITEKARAKERKWDVVGVVKDKELKLEDVKAPHTLVCLLPRCPFLSVTHTRLCSLLLINNGAVTKCFFATPSKKGGQEGFNERKTQA